MWWPNLEAQMNVLQRLHRAGLFVQKAQSSLTREQGESAVQVSWSQGGKSRLVVLYKDQLLSHVNVN